MVTGIDRCGEGGLRFVICRESVPILLCTQGVRGSNPLVSTNSITTRVSRDLAPPEPTIKAGNHVAGVSTLEEGCQQFAAHDGDLRSQPLPIPSHHRPANARRPRRLQSSITSS